MASALALKLMRRFYGGHTHPYEYFEKQVKRYVVGDRANVTLLDIGCGRDAPVLRKFKAVANNLIGLDLIDFRGTDASLTLLRGSISDIPLPDQSVDVAMARSVIEHVADPVAGLKEVYRVLKPGGVFVFLTPNLWDYASLIALLVPNRFHARVVAMTEGRAEEDVFPTVYKCNTKKRVRTIARLANFEVIQFSYLSQYPNYFLFNGVLFLIATAYEKIISNVYGLNFLKGWILVTVAKVESGDAPK